MHSKIKALGLALVAVFAMSAVLASAAQALTAEVEGGGTAEVTGTTLSHNGTTSHTFTTFFGTITCTTIEFTGSVANGATTLVVTPTYDNCSIGTKPVTITQNGCKYTFHGGVEEAADTFKEQEVDMGGCNAGAAGIEIHVYENATKHANGEKLCTYVVAPFTNKKGNTVENTTTASPKKDIDSTATVEHVAIKRTLGTLLSCGTENQEETYTGKTTLRGYSDAAHTTQIGIAVK